MPIQLVYVKNFLVFFNCQTQFAAPVHDSCMKNKCKNNIRLLEKLIFLNNWKSKIKKKEIEFMNEMLHRQFNKTYLNVCLYIL